MSVTDGDSTVPRAVTTRIVLLALLVVFAGLSVAYSTLLPLKFGPDEPAHFIYIRSLATQFRVPPIAHTITSTEDSTESHEAHQPPLFYLAMAIPHAALNAAGVPSDAIWRALRFLNIAFGVLWIWTVFRLALVLFRDERKALWAAAFVAVIPSATYMSGVLSNDILESLLFTWALVLLLPVFRGESVGVRGAVWRGVVIGLAVLAKAQGLALIAMELVAFALVARRTHRARITEQLRESGVAMTVCLLVCGWWFIRCKLELGTAFPHSLYDPAAKPGMLTWEAVLAYPTLAAYLVGRTVLAATKLAMGFFWAPYWLVENVLPWRPYMNAIYTSHVIVLLGMVIAFVRDRGEWRRDLGYLILAPILVYVSYVQYLMVVDQGTQMQGRLFLPVAGIFGLCVVVAAGAFRAESVRSMLMGALCAGLLGFNVWLLVTAATHYVPVR